MLHKWTFFAQIVSVVDGDTLKLDVDQGFRNWILGENFRLARIDTPELKKDNNKGHESKGWVEEFIKNNSDKNKTILIECSKHGRYRWVIEVYLREFAGSKKYTINLNDMIVKAGMGVYKKY